MTDPKPAPTTDSISEAKPVHHLPTDTDNGMLLIVSGPSGVGKTTIARAIERTIPDAVFSISATTREPTDVDTDGVDYHFLTEDQFQEKIDANEFLEYATFAGKRYGTLLAPTMTQLERGRLLLLDIDVQGCEQIKEKMPSAYSMFILPPSGEELLRRLEARKRESKEEIRDRYAVAQEEIHRAKTSGSYDAFVVNTELEAAIEEAVELVKKRRSV